MRIHVFVTSEALEDHPSLHAGVRGCGAFVEFRGVVRPTENEAAISGLEYEAYQPMAEQKIKQILEELVCEFPCEEIRVMHRIGVVAVAEAAIIVQVAARHRGEAFGLIPRFMDRLKADVPIWKVRVIL